MRTLVFSQTGKTIGEIAVKVLKPTKSWRFISSWSTATMEICSRTFLAIKAETTQVCKLTF
jgi:hypothetical protein